MAISGNNHVNFQRNIDAMHRKDMSTVSDSKMQNLVKTANTGATEQTKKSKDNQGAKEMSHLSEAAQKAMEAELVKDAENQGKAHNAQGQAGLEHTKGKRKKSEEFDNGKVGGGEHHNYAPGDQQKLPDGGVIVHGDDETPAFEIPAAGAKRLGQLDAKGYVEAKYVETMPDPAKALGKKMASEKVATPKQREKYADLKMGSSSFSSEVEGVILKKAETFQKSGTRKASIRSPKHEKPLKLEDNSEDVAKEAAKYLLETGGAPSEAFMT